MVDKMIMYQIIFSKLEKKPESLIFSVRFEDCTPVNVSDVYQVNIFFLRKPYFSAQLDFFLVPKCKICYVASTVPIRTFLKKVSVFIEILEDTI